MFNIEMNSAIIVYKLNVELQFHNGSWNEINLKKREKERRDRIDNHSRNALYFAKLKTGEQFIVIVSL